MRVSRFALCAGLVLLSIGAQGQVWGLAPQPAWGGAVLNSTIEACEANRKYQVEQIHKLVDEGLAAEETMRSLAATVENGRDRLDLLNEEKEKVVAEMRQEVRCSACKRTSAEFGGSGKFTDHIIKNGTRMEHIPPEEIKAKEDEYDAKIESLTKAMADYDRANFKRLVVGSSIQGCRIYWYGAVEAEDHLLWHEWSNYEAEMRRKYRTLKRQIVATQGLLAKQTPDSPGAKALQNVVDGLQASLAGLAEQFVRRSAAMSANLQAFRSGANAERDSLHASVAQLSEEYFMPGSVLANGFGPINFQGFIPEHPVLTE